MNWFNVDKNGLAKLMEGRGKAFVLYELVQNAWDEASKTVIVTIQPVEGTRNVEIRVEDDNPEGFADLSHAYTLFAESNKKTDATKRGRFNMGEKLVLALAKSASIETTKGSVDFSDRGRHEYRDCRPFGSTISVTIAMTRAEMVEIIAAARRLIPPPGIKTTINGEEIPHRPYATWFETTLPTLIGDGEGVLRRTDRKTLVRVYEPAPGEAVMLYEMGIPVVETGDRYHVDVQQKVPLNMDRDNVTPGYLKAVRVAVLNHTHALLTEQDASKTWVRDACSAPEVENLALKRAISLRFGENAVTFDPSDLEANKISASESRQLVHGAHLTRGEWENVRRAGILLPAGQVTPSPRPYHPEGKPLNLIPPANWSPGMVRVADFAKDVARELLGRRSLPVQIANEFDWNTAATFGKGADLVLNLARLGHKFFDGGITNEVIDLIIHEFGHHYSGDHLSSDYYDALTDLGARMTRLALDKPELFR